MKVTEVTREHLEVEIKYTQTKIESAKARIIWLRSLRKATLQTIK